MSIIHLLLTNMEDSIDSIKVHSIPLLFPSDHYSITFNLSFSEHLLNKQLIILTKGDYQRLYEYLSYLDLSSCFLSHNVEFIWEAIELIISNAIRLFIPFTKIHCNHQPSWFTANIRHHKCLHTLRHRNKRHPTRFLKEKIKLSDVSLQSPGKNCRN